MQNIVNYPCEMGYIDEKYHFVRVHHVEFLKWLVPQFNACVDFSIIIFMNEHYPSKIRHAGFKCPCKNITITPVILDFDQYSSHYTIIMIDHDKREIEYFDPNSYSEWLQPVEQELINLCKKKFPTFKFIDNLSYCPVKGIQKISNKRWCTVFSLLYIYLRLNNSDRSSVMNELTQMKKRKINNLASKFICFIYDTLVKFKLYIPYIPRTYDELALENEITELSQLVVDKYLILYHNIKQRVRSNAKLISIYHEHIMDILTDFNVGKVKNLQETHTFFLDFLSSPDHNSAPINTECWFYYPQYWPMNYLNN